MLIVILIDALDKSYFTDKNMPFLFNLTKNNLLVKKYLPLAGFEHRHYLLWSKYPDEINRFSQYCLDKESPFRYLKKIVPILKFIDKIPKIKFGVRYLISIYTKWWKKLEYCNTARIPYPFLINFSSKGEDKPLDSKNLYTNHKSLFDVFRKKKIKYKYLWWPFPKELDNDTDRINKAIEVVNSKKKSILFLHLSSLDRFGHKYKRGQKLTNEIKKMDNLLKDFFEKSKIKKFLIFGDHGMAQVVKWIDINKKILQLIKNKKISEKTQYFIDSTTLRFWPEKKEEKNRIINFLKTQNKIGTLINKKLINKYHLRFNDNRFGEIIFILKKGYVFSPDFFSDKRVNGMHGYLPKDNPSILICSNNKKKIILNANETSIAPTILDLLNLPNEKEFSGKSLLK